MISEKYRALNRKALEETNTFATSGGRIAGEVREIINQNPDLRSILDYGCGRELLQMAIPERNIRGYDPAVPGLSDPPAPADLVVCNDVLEHVEPEFIDNVVSDLRRVTLRFGFFVIATNPATKTILADGSNPHRIVEHEHYWLPMIFKHNFRLRYFLRKGGHLTLLVE